MSKAEVAAEKIATLAVGVKEKLRRISDEMDRIDVGDLRVSFNQLRVWITSLDTAEDRLSEIINFADDLLDDPDSALVLTTMRVEAPK